ncbi:MAG: cytochrome c [Aquimonas sp.]|nr:cytochrome c [Aquimonas sp.]
MRERMARHLALLTGLMVILLSAAFAAVQNPAAEGAASAAAAASGDAQLQRGRAVFEANDCQRCHSVDGQGSPRSPLDGVGARLSAEELLHFSVADESVQDDLAPRAIAAKRPYAELPTADLEALVAYLGSLK